MEEISPKDSSNYNKHECMSATIRRCIIQIYAVYKGKTWAYTKRLKLKR